VTLTGCPRHDRSEVKLRRYEPGDETAAHELWRRSWQTAYPAIDFDARMGWWRKRWRDELLPQAAVVVAEVCERLVGFVTVDQTTGYLDQIVVAPEAWGGGIADLLLLEAKRLSPEKLVLHVNIDNTRAVAFYRRHGFAVTSQDVNPRSGAAIYVMRWPAESPRAGSGVLEL
jgi:putative acetyltransferase